MTTSHFSAVLVAVAAAALLAACSTGPREQHLGAAPGMGLGVFKIGKPYQVDGVWYYPHEDWNYDETGIASWYGEQFHGKYTANGEVFDLNALTAAHHTLPLPSIVEVTNLENGRTIDLRVNDRGPFARGRVIDVSRRAAQLLGFERQGTAKVHVRLLTPETLQAEAVARRNGSEGEPRSVVQVAEALPRTAVDARPLTALPGSRTAPAPVQTASTQPTAAGPVAGAAPMIDPPLSEKVRTVSAHPNAQIYVQAGAFSQLANANRVKRRISSVGAAQITGVRINGANLFRVRLGPVATVAEADRLLAKVLAAGISDAKIVVD